MRSIGKPKPCDDVCPTALSLDVLTKSGDGDDGERNVTALVIIVLRSREDE